MRPLDQRRVQAMLDADGFRVASVKHKDAHWVELTPTVWVWAAARRGLKS